MTREESIKILKEQIDLYEWQVEDINAMVNPRRHNEYQNTINSLKMAIKALEQDPCEDEEYEKNLNELKEQIFKEGNTLISKQDLLERFVEIDNEYKNSHWNLLQILANIDILIGKEPCEDCISRQAVLDIIEKEEFKGDAISEIEKLPSVKPTQNISIQITEREKYGRFN